MFEEALSYFCGKMVSSRGEWTVSPPGWRPVSFEEFIENTKSGQFSLGAPDALDGFESSQLFSSIKHETLSIIKNNNQFLEEMYLMIRERLPDPLSLKMGRNFNDFADTILLLAESLGLTPNLLSDQEFVQLYVLSRRMRRFLDSFGPEEDDPKLSDYLYDFNEFKMLVVTLAKYFCQKFGHIYKFYEETFLQNLLWFFFITLINDPQFNIDKKMYYFNQNKEENILFQLSRTNLSSIGSLDSYLHENLEHIFLIFANNFSKVGNPHLLLDIKKLLAVPDFKGQSAWISKYLRSNYLDFTTFIEFLKHVLYVKPKSSASDFKEVFDKFVVDNDLQENTFMISPPGKLPPLDEQIVYKIKYLFKKFSANGTVVYVMDFLFMAKETRIVPDIMTNRDVMTLFFQQSIRRSLSHGKKLSEIMEADNIYYVNIEDFAKLLLEAAERLVLDTLPLDVEEKLKILFGKTVRI